MKTRALTFALALLGLGLFAGCTTVQLSDNGAVTGEYKLGQLVTQSHAGLNNVYAATKTAFRQMGFLLVHDERASDTAVLRARDSQDNLIEVKLKELGPDYTSVKIRYGITGNLGMSQTLYRAIAKGS